MSHDNDFKRDLAEIAAHKLREGRITKRGFLTAMGALGVIPMIGMGTKAKAAPDELVIVNWGGKAADIIKEVLGDTYKEATGIDVVIDGSGPSAGRIRAMVESGAVVWDVCDSGPGSAIILGEAGVTEPMNYDIIDRSKMMEGTDWEYGAGNYVYSYVLAVNPALSEGGVPANWADVFDTKNFPGMRTFRKAVRGQLECATMAQGVPLEEVYDVLSTEDGINAAIDQFRKIRENVIVWGSGSESQNLFLQEEVVMGNIWSTRAHLLKDEMEEGTFQISFDGGVMSPGTWVVPKNNPAGAEEAMKFIAFAQDPELQVKWLELIGCAPINPEAAPLVPESMSAWNPTSPENVATQILYNDEWYAANQVAAEEKYVNALIN